MKKRLALGIGVLCLLCVGFYFLDSVHRIQLIGWVRNEKFYRDMPSHYWFQAIEGANGNQRYEAILALGRVSEAIPALTARLQDPVPMLRHLAAVELGRFGAEARSAVAALTGMLKDDDHSCRQAAREALEKINPVSLSQAP